MNGMDDFDSDQMPMRGSERERPMTETDTPEDDGETIHIPTAFLQGTKFKEGDELVLKVVSVDEDGLEVAYAKAPPEGEAAEEGSASGDSGSELDELDRNSEY